MPNKRPVYPPEYRRQLIDLVRSGRSADGLTTVEREELVRLRRENRELKIEREILKKAAAWFARESDSSPKKGSGS